MAGRHAQRILGLGLLASLMASILGFFAPREMLVEFGNVTGIAALHGEEEEDEDGLRPDSPGEWARFRKWQQADEKGVVAPNGAVVAMGRRKALARAGTLAGLGKGMQQAAIAGVTPGAGSGSWTWIGPGNIGGRTRAIVIDPSNPSRMLLGSAGGGIWSSANGGASWTAVADFLGSLAVSALALSPASPAVVYAGTGEGFYNCDSLRGAGIFKSSDGGTTWGQLAATNPALNSDWLHVNRIAVHPTNPRIILAATGGVSAGVRCSDAPSSAGGLYRSSDGGASWTKVFSTAGVVDVRFQPTLGTNAIISVRLGFYDYAIYYSNDTGSSWTLSNLGSGSGGRKEIAYSGTAAYVSVDNSTSGTSGQVWSSVNGGATWVLKGTPNHLNGQGWYANAIWADPTNAQHLIVGGLDLWRSLNGGTSWTRISDWTATPNSAHADHHVIVSSPGYGTSDRTLYFGNDGGIYKTADIQAVTSPTIGWTSLNNGLGVTQFYDGAGQMISGTTPLIVGGTQDNGSLFYLNNGTTQWERYFGGDGGFSAVDVSTPAMTRAYGEYVYLMLHRADGLDKRFAGGSYTTRSIYAGIGDAGNPAASLFIAPFALDPNNPGIMYAGGASLWRTTNVTDSNPTWAAVAASGSIISQIAVADGSSSTVWFGTTKGAMFASTTATPAFTSRSTGLPSRMVLSILIDRRTPSTVYAGFGGYAGGNLYRTTNAGASWTNIHGNLPAVPIYSIVGHPTKPSFLYVGTEVGVFASEDGGATWSTTNDGPANVAVVKLFWLNNTTLVAATHGRGMFTATIPESTAILTVAKAGNGTGTVASTPAGINCGATCSASFVVSASVTLSASPASGSVFVGWSGACSGTGACTVPMATAQNVTANFALQTFPLTVSRAGNGSGTVASMPAGISCGASCVSSFVAAASVVLTASPAAGSVFAGWSGACSGTGACIVSMTAAQNVTASFTLQIFPLTVSRGGNGSGTVTSTPAGISCGSTCTVGLVANSQVTLAAAPAAGSVFAGWSGACSGMGACTVSMTAAQNVTASFSLPVVVYGLTITTVGAGTVSSSPAGLNCTAACTASFPSGSTLVLTATPASGYVFAGWSGACTGTGACSLAMTSAKAVEARFTAVPPSTVSLLQNGAALTRLAGSANSMQMFAIDVPAGARNLVVASSGGTGNADLYVRYGQRPVVGLAQDCVPLRAASTETCQFSTPGKGTYFIMLRGASAFAAVSLSATYSTSNSKR